MNAVTPMLYLRQSWSQSVRIAPAIELSQEVQMAPTIGLKPPAVHHQRQLMPPCANAVPKPCDEPISDQCAPMLVPYDAQCRIVEPATRCGLPMYAIQATAC
jgi:hypothetical protein